MSSSLKEVAPGFHRIETVVTGTRMPLAIYLVDGDTWTVTDTGCVGMMRELAVPAAEALRSGSRIGRAVVCHAHADHFGGNAELLELVPSCTIFAHEADAAWAREPAFHLRDSYGALGADYPCPPEATEWVGGLLGLPAPVESVVAGHAFPLADGRSLTVIHLPGHSSGQIGLWEASQRVLLLSDALLGSGQRIDDVVVGIPSYLNVADYLASIAAVRALAPAVCCPAHFSVMDEEQTQAFCDLSEAFVKELEAAAWSELGGGQPRTLREITAAVVPRLAPHADVGVTAAFSVQAHLDEFEARGMAAWRMRGEERAWSRTWENR